MFHPLFQKVVKLSIHFSAISTENKIKVKLSRKFSNSLTVTMAADMLSGSSPLIAMEMASKKMRTMRNFWNLSSVANACLSRGDNSARVSASTAKSMTSH